MYWRVLKLLKAHLCNEYVLFGGEHKICSTSNGSQQLSNHGRHLHQFARQQNWQRWADYAVTSSESYPISYPTFGSKWVFFEQKQHFSKQQKKGYTALFIDGADAGTWTRTDRSTRSLVLRVYHFRHDRTCLFWKHE